MLRKKRFECYSCSSKGKFWECWVEGNKFVSENGAIGAKPKRWTRIYSSHSEAEEKMAMMIEEKTRWKTPWDRHGTYDRVLFLSEENIRDVLCRWLKNQNWEVTEAHRKAQGPDIVAKKEYEKWVIEVKGYCAKDSKKESYFLTVLGEALRNMDDPQAQYYIAFPDIYVFRSLWDRLPDLTKSRTGIMAIFVDVKKNITFQK